jgi:hypothetical protein
MSNVVEEIPQELRAEVDAALAFWNQRQPEPFKLTGVIDPDRVIAARTPGAEFELPLVLCRGDLCVRESFLLQPMSSGIGVRHADTEAADPPGEVDPLPGARIGWLDEILAKHDFALIHFYRGLW